MNAPLPSFAAHLKDKNLFRQQCYVDGAWVDADDKSTLAVHNPANDQQIGTVPKMGVAETRRAIEAAHAAWPAWRAKTAKERSNILRKWFELMMANQEDLARLMPIEHASSGRASRGARGSPANPACCAREPRDFAAAPVRHCVDRLHGRAVDALYRGLQHLPPQLSAQRSGRRCAVLYRRVSLRRREVHRGDGRLQPRDRHLPAGRQGAGRLLQARHDVEGLGQLDRARESWETLLKTFPDAEVARLGKQNLDRLARAKPKG